MKIAIVVARYSVSGVPLAQIRMAGALVALGHSVDLIFGYVGDARLPDTGGANVFDLGRNKVRDVLAPIARYLSAARPDVVFAAEDHLNALVLVAAILVRSKAKISCSSRVTPFDTYSNRRFSKRWLLKKLVKAVNWRADALTCVSKAMVAQYREVLGSSSHVFAYNIVADDGASERMRAPVDEKWLIDRQAPVLIAAGSLEPWKGFSDLVAAVAMVKAEGRDVRLLIFGDGSLRGALQRQISDLGLTGQIRLAGRKNNLLRYFARADVFVLSSHVEGLPNVLVEAMMCGCTPVATDCPTGPREVLQGDRYGYLVPVSDSAAMARAIIAALDHPIAPELLAEAVAPFSEKTVIDRHFALLGITDTN